MLSPAAAAALLPSQALDVRMCSCMLLLFALWRTAAGFHARCKELKLVPCPAGLLPKVRLSGRHGSKPQLPIKVRIPHTTQIRTVGDGAVELEFTSLDPLLGAHNFFSLSKGIATHSMQLLNLRNRVSVTVPFIPFIRQSHVV